MHFRCKSFVRHLYCECALPFHSHNGVFGRIELLNFNMKPLINFSSIVITYILFNIFFPSSISPKPPSIFPRSFIFNLSQWDVKSIRNWVLWMAFKPISSLMQVAREPSTVCWREPSPPHCPSEVLLFWIRHVHGFVLLVNWSIPNFPNKKWFFFFLVHPFIAQIQVYEERGIFCNGEEMGLDLKSVGGTLNILRK